MAFMIIIFMITLIFGGSFLVYQGCFWGLFFLLAGILMLFGFKKIPAVPPNIGLVTCWGERTDLTKREGWRLLAPYFPFLYDVILIDMTKKNKTFVFEKIRCVVSANVKTDASPNGNIVRSGGSIKVVVSITWVPDAENLIAYLNSGKERGIEQIISGKLAENIRQMGRTHNWEQMAFATDVMNANLLISIVGLDNIKKQMNNSNKWRWGNKLGYQMSNDELKEASNFLHQALTDGVADNGDLGIRIHRLNIKEVVPEGLLRQDAENYARKIQQRRAQDFELETELELARVLEKAYQQTNKPKSIEDCVLEVRRRKAIREGHGKVIDIAGLSHDIIEAASKLIER